MRTDTNLGLELILARLGLVLPALRRVGKLDELPLAMKMQQVMRSRCVRACVR